MATNRSLQSLPLLSRGKHRRPRNGACLMEFTAVLAGERWSDHPACTHPLLAELARQVNDFTSDEARQALAELAPDMIGLAGADPRVDLRIALRAARAALPVVAEERQRAMAAAVMTCERLTAELDGNPGAPISAESAAVLALAPGAARWARRYTRNLSVCERAFRRRAAPSVVRYAVQGIARACIPDPDALLRDLLVGAIGDCTTLVAAPRRTAGGSRPAPVRPADATVAAPRIVVGRSGP